MAHLNALVHADVRPVATFATFDEVKQGLEAVLREERSWITWLWIEPFRMVVAEHAD